MTKINAEDIVILYPPYINQEEIIFGIKCKTIQEAEALKQSILNNDEIVSRIENMIAEHDKEIIRLREMGFLENTMSRLDVEITKRDYLKSILDMEKKE